MPPVNNIVFQKGQGGSGRIAPGSDFITGLMFYNNTRPAALLASLPGGVDNFSTGSVVPIFSPSQAKALGIDNSFSDETPSVAAIVITNAGSTGDQITISVTEWIGGSGKGTIVLGSYTNASSDNVETVVDNLIAAINANTNTTGYTAADIGDTETTVFITARPGIGVYFNSGTPYTKAVTGGMAATIHQPTGSNSTVLGVYSKLAVTYYHINRYFAAKPDGQLYVGIFNTAGSGTFSDLRNIMKYSNGAVVQCGVWDDVTTFANASLTAIQTVLNNMELEYLYLSSVVYASDIKAFNSGSGQLAALAGGAYNLASIGAADKVTALIDNDGNANGFDLFQATGKSITSLGAAMGCISEASISEDIGNLISRFDVDDGVEFDTLMFGDGTLYNTVAKPELDALNSNRYLFLTKFPYTPGSFYSDDHTSIAYTSDYAWIHDNRIIDRVIRNSIPTLAPVLKSKLDLNLDGTLTAVAIAHLTQLEGEVIKPLIASGDLAGDAANFDPNDWVKINPAQQPNQTNTLVIAVVLYEDGIAHNITVPVGFAVK